MKYTFIILLLVCGISVSAQKRETRNVDKFTKVAFRTPGTLYLKQGSPQKVEIEGNADVLEKIETEIEGSRLVIQTKSKWSNWNWGNNDKGDKIKVYVTVENIEALSVSGSGDLVGENKITASELDLNVSGSGSLTVDADVSGDVDADVSGSGDLKFKGKCNHFDSDVSGSGKVILAASMSGKANLGVSGSGKIEASGSANEVEADISGSGKVLAANLETKRCEVKISGSGDVEINVKEEIDANITGSGTVSYRGNPSKVNSHASGSGTVRKM